MSKKLTENERFDAFSRDDDSEGVKKRVTSLVKRWHEAEERAEAAEAAAEERAKVAARKAREEADQEWGSKMTAREEDLSLARLGIHDDDTIHLLRRDYSRLPEKDRPPLADYARTLQTDPKARDGKSPALVAGLGVRTGQGPSISEGAGKAPEFNEETVRAAFGKGPDGVKELMSRLGS